jgi:hypothetical protein
MGMFCSREAALPKPSHAARQLRNIEDTYRKRMGYIEGQQSMLRTQALAHLRQQQPRTARSCMRQRLLLGRHLSTLENYIDTITALRGDIEAMIITRETIEGIRVSAQVMGELRRRIDPDEVEGLLENVRDVVEASQQVLRTISDANIDLEHVSGIDDAELEREFQALVLEDAPSPPTVLPTSTNTSTNDDGIEGLQRSMIAV